jgi:hypothetical protein
MLSLTFDLNDFTNKKFVQIINIDGNMHVTLNQLNIPKILQHKLSMQFWHC